MPMRQFSIDADAIQLGQMRPDQDGLLGGRPSRKTGCSPGSVAAQGGAAAIATDPDDAPDPDGLHDGLAVGSPG